MDPALGSNHHNDPVLAEKIEGLVAKTAFFNTVFNIQIGYNIMY